MSCNLVFSKEQTIPVHATLSASLLFYHTHLIACVSVLSSCAKSPTAAQITLKMFESHSVNVKSSFQSMTSKYDYEHLIQSIENESVSKGMWERLNLLIAHYRAIS